MKSSMLGCFVFLMMAAPAASLAQESLEALQQGLRKLEQQTVVGDPRLTAARHELARAYHAQGREEEAERLLKHVLVMTEDASGPHSRDLAAVFVDLAVVYQAEGRTTEMEPILKRIVDIREWHKSSEPLDYAQALNALAAYYNVFQRYAEAVPLCEKALQIDRGMLGDRHPDVATDLNNLAVLQQHLGRMDDAKALYRKAIAIWEVVGPVDSGLAETLHDYALLLQQRGETLEAKVAEGRARTILSSR